jgi:Arc/MetJ-type ribon-helix-helix transcriptional regulator
MNAIPTKLTPKLILEIDKIVNEGWFANRSEFIREAVRELVNKSKIERLEAAVKEDIQFGLYGKE